MAGAAIREKPEAGAQKKLGDKPADKSGIKPGDKLRDKAADDKNAESQDAVPKKTRLKGKNKLIAIAATVVAIAGGGSAAWYFTSTPSAPSVAPAATPTPAKAEAPRKDPIFVSIEPFTVNLRDTTQERYLQLAIVFEASDPKLSDKIKLYTPAIRNRLLLLLSSKDSGELSKREGKEQLAAEIASETRKVLNLDAKTSGIEAVHFSNMIIQ